MSSPPSPAAMAPSMSMQGTLLLAVLLDAALFGLVSQQFYTYWTMGFKDSMRLRIFIIVQYVLVAFQSLIMWRMLYTTLIVFNHDPSRINKAALWEGPANSLCQLFIILQANICLATRIKGLTESRIQSGTVIALSSVAFVFGIVTIVTTCETPKSTSYTPYTSAIWHAIQALAECLITFFLSRALLQSRSGIAASDSVVLYLVHNVIQTGFLAATWAIVALVTWFFLPKVCTYRIFDMTSGAVYTQAMFEALLSRRRLREHLLPSNYLDFEMPTEASRTPGRFLNSGNVARFVPAVLDISKPEPGPSLTANRHVWEVESIPGSKEDSLHQT